MGKRIACICGKPGRVQHTRMKFLRDNYLSYLDVYADDVPDLKKYDVVYFSHYSLAKKVKFGGAKLASVTSHKYDKKELGKFDRISVNNRILLKELAEFNPVLTENGVDTKFWTSTTKRESGDIRMRVGWVGNGDRAAKRYHIIKELMFETSSFLAWHTVVSSKREKEQPCTPEELRDYYRALDAFVVISESEGTPNPALEAMACDVPVLSTPVGNMVDIRAVLLFETKNELIFKLGAIAGDWDADYGGRDEMVKDWDWSIKYKAWDNFFKEWL